MKRLTLALAFALGALLALPGGALAAPSPQLAGAAPGAVFALAGTPHLWIAGEDGALHWGGDTRALVGRTIRWGDRREVSLAEVRSHRIGDPWLSAGLLKMDDPIYLVTWETEWVQPILRPIQSITDVEVFGINHIRRFANGRSLLGLVGRQAGD